MKKVYISIISLIIILLLVFLYTYYAKLPFENTQLPSKPQLALDYTNLLKAQGYDTNVPKIINTLPYLNTRQLRNQPITKLMEMNSKNKEIIFENELNQNYNLKDTEQTEQTYEITQSARDNSSIIPATSLNEIGATITDIGKSLYEMPGEINMSYAGYKVNNDYTLLPANLYNNHLDYKQNNTNFDLDSNKEENTLDKLPKFIIQKDFSGVSNIFAPNFVFLGNKDDYNIGFDNMEYP
jgi:hypothetical protein